MEVQENIPFNDPKEPNRETTDGRPVWLMVLCILTFVYSGISCLGYCFFVSKYDFLPQLMEQARDMMVSIYGDKVDVSQALVVQPRMYYLLLCLLYAGSVTGAAFMLGLRKMGFHIYTVAQALLLVAPVLFVHLPFNVGDLLVTVAFVLLYATFLKQMR